jgi:RNA polymerase sigma-70 factor (ECF subfamily)
MTKRDGDLADLVARRGQALLGYARALCGDPQQAEDLVQDALVKVYSRWLAPGRTVSGRAASGTGGVVIIPLTEGEAALPNEAYVRRAILTLFLDGRRRASRWSKVRHLLAANAVAPSGDADVGIDIAHTLQALSPQQRACVLLRFYDDLTVPQIAAQLGIAPGTVSGYLAEATRSLRGALAPLDGSPLEGEGR